MNCRWWLAVGRWFRRFLPIGRLRAFSSLNAANCCQLSRPPRGCRFPRKLTKRDAQLSYNQRAKSCLARHKRPQFDVIYGILERLRVPRAPAAVGCFFSSGSAGRRPFLRRRSFSPIATHLANISGGWKQSQGQPALMMVAAAGVGGRRFVPSSEVQTFCLGWQTVVGPSPFRPAASFRPLNSAFKSLLRPVPRPHGGQKRSREKIVERRDTCAALLCPIDHLFVDLPVASGPTDRPH